MSNSPLVQYVKISPNSTNPRRKQIRKITIHHMAGMLSVETCGEIFARPERKASSNYAVGVDGRIAMYVEEKNRAWTSSSSANDDEAVTIEVANCEIGGQWRVSDYVLERTIELCVDICKRNGIERLNFTGDTTGNLTMHKWFAATSCPGPYLESKFPYIAEEVNRRLKAAASPSTGSGTLYYVQTGAYSKKPNADAQATKLKTKGYDTYIVIAGGLYKVQVGAYSQKANAEAMAKRLKADGFDCFITTEAGTPAGNAQAPATAPTLKAGSKVKVKNTATKYSTGQTIPNWVKGNTYTVLQIGNGRILLKEIVSWVNTSDVEVVG